MDLTQSQVADALGLSPQSFPRFLSENLSFPLPRVSGRREWYDAATIRQWLSERLGERFTEAGRETATLARFDHHLKNIRAARVDRGELLRSHVTTSELEFALARIVKSVQSMRDVSPDFPRSIRIPGTAVNAFYYSVDAVRDWLLERGFAVDSFDKRIAVVLSRPQQGQ